MTRRRIDEQGARRPASRGASLLGLGLLGVTTLAGLTPSPADAQSCSCTAEGEACCGTWDATRYEVRGTVTSAGLTLGEATATGAAPAPEATPSTAGVPSRVPSRGNRIRGVDRPSPIAAGPLLPPFPVELPRDHPIVGTFVEPYARLVELSRQPGATAEAQDVAFGLIQGLGTDGGDVSERWLLIGDVRVRIAELAVRVARERFQACMADGDPTACGAQPRLSLEYARRAFEAAARTGAGTPYALEGLLRAAETLVDTPRHGEAGLVFDRLTAVEDARIRERAQARLTETRLLEGNVVAAARAAGAVEGEGYEVFQAYVRMAGLATAGPAPRAREAAYAFLALPEARVPEDFRRYAARLAAVVSGEAGREGTDAFDTAPEGSRPLLHAAMADVTWEARHRILALAHARAGLEAFPPEARPLWEERLGIAPEPEETVAETPEPEEPTTVVYGAEPPGAEDGAVGWLGFVARRCLAEATAARPPFRGGRVRWLIRMRGTQQVAQSAVRGGAAGSGAVVRCLNAPGEPPVRPAEEIQITATLDLEP
ncbi:MAG: hypothetical protein ACFCGT_02125 [Sandaracinaceae bacterium]